jgi:hypothetical protein
MDDLNYDKTRDGIAKKHVGGRDWKQKMTIRACGATESANWLMCSKRKLFLSMNATESDLYLISCDRFCAV